MTRPDVPLPPDAAAPPDPAYLAAAARLAERAAREAGSLLRDHRPATVEVAETKSSPTDVVTAMDHAAEALVRSILLGEHPDDGLLGEESGLQAGTSGLTWVVDPLDGTVNYLYGLPAFAVSIALTTGDPTVPGAWAPLAGCVYAPTTRETWTAVRGAGAFLDGQRLQVPDAVAPPAALVGTGFGYLAPRRRVQARVLGSLLPEVRDIRRMGSAAIDLCLVATGRLDAFYERGLNAWDLAAAMLVVTEAGGAVRGTSGRPPGSDMVVAAAEPLCGWLAVRLEELDAARDD